MASHTQFYMTNASQHPWQPTGFQGTWDLTPVAGNTGFLVPYKGGGSALGFPRAETSATDPFKVCILKMLLGPLEAQTFGGTVDCILGTSESDAAGNFFWAWHLYVSQGESDLVRGTLLNNYVEDTTNEWPTTAAGIALQAPQSLSAVVAQQGDYLVAELGYIARNSSTSSFTGTLYSGSTGINVIAGLLADLTLGSTNVTTRAGFLTFSQAVDLYEPAPATDDLIASNFDLYVYGGNDGALKKRIFIPRFAEPAGGVQDAAGNFYVTDELNQRLFVFDGTLDGGSYTTIDVSPGEIPHAAARNADDLIFVGYTGDGSGTTACGDQGASATATYPKTTGSIDSTTATYPARSFAPPGTATHTIVANAGGVPLAFSVLRATVAETFANNSGTQPVGKVGKTGDDDFYFPAATFVNQTLGATFNFGAGTIAVGEAITATWTDASDLTATGALQIFVDFDGGEAGLFLPARTVAPPSTIVHELVADDIIDRPFTMTVTVLETFANVGGGSQPTFAIGTTAAPSTYFPTSSFTSRAAGTTYQLNGTLPAGQDLNVTQVEATNLDSTGSLEVSVSLTEPDPQTLLASSGSDRNVLINVEVVEAFLNGDGSQPVFQVGSSSDADEFFASSTFANQPLGAVFSTSGVLSSGDALLVGAVRALGTTSSGSIRVTVIATGFPTQASMSIRSFTTTGTPVGVFPCEADQCGSNSIDLAADQATMFYTSLGREIKRYNVAANAQMDDFATLPAATSPEQMARGVKVLPDGGVVVADVADIKRYASSGALIATISVDDQDDWGTVALSSTGQYLWVANTANDNVSDPMIIKVDLQTNAVILTIEGDAVPETAGGLCSGGISVWNGFRAATSDETIYPNFEIEEEPRRWLRRAPIMHSENRRVFYNLFELEMQTGVGLPSGAPEDVEPMVMMRFSNDSGRTWSNELWRSMGRIGKYLTRIQWWRLGLGRQRVFEASGSAKVRTIILGGNVDIDPSEDAPKN